MYEVYDAGGMTAGLYVSGQEYTGNVSIAMTDFHRLVIPLNPLLLPVFWPISTGKMENGVGYPETSEHATVFWSPYRDLLISSPPASMTGSGMLGALALPRQATASHVTTITQHM